MQRETLMDFARQVQMVFSCNLLQTSTVFAQFNKIFAKIIPRIKLQMKMELDC